MIHKECAEMERICRSCMSESSQMRNVFETKTAQEGTSLQLAAMIMACTSIQITKDDGLPVNLCQVCEIKLDTAFKFRQQVEKTDTALRQISNTATKSSHSIKFETCEIVSEPDMNPVESECSDTNGEECTNTTESSHSCSYCHKVLRTKKGLIFHQRLHTGNKLCFCHICPAKFTRTNHLNRHLQLHKSNRESTAKIDDATIKSDLEDNEMEDSDTEVVYDDLKDEDYTLHKKRKCTRETEDKNKENEREKQVMECEFCDRKFKYKKSFAHHMETEHGMSEDTDIHVNTISDLKEIEEVVDLELDSNADVHKDTTINLPSSEEEHNLFEENQDNAIKTSKQRKQYTCHVCSVKFNRTNHLTRHMTIHRAVLIHKCDKCEKAYATTEHLDAHIQQEHINKPYICNICDKQFVRGEPFIRHLKSHEDSGADDIHKCSICDKLFTRSDHLARHTKAHLQKEKRHICGECGKAFNRLDNLKTHQRIHSGLKDNSRSHLCIYCGKDFNSSSNMIVHMRRHTGERPYKCSICSKGFPRSHDLKCHERTHSGEKPYLCTHCGKSFNKSNKLLRHTRVHTGERPYVCSICGRAFTQSNDLALHMRRHTGARPYVCGVCPARFIQSGQLKAHRRSNNHWMDIPPDLKGGHRVEQVTPIINPVPIKFKTHGKSDLKLKDEEIYEDVKEEPQNLVKQTNLMRMENDMTILPSSYVLDNSKLLHPPFFVLASVFNQAAQVGLDPELYKEEIEKHSRSDNSVVAIKNIDRTSTPTSSALSYTVTPMEQYNYESYG